MSKRRFGRVRRLASGRWQARYPGPDGIDRPAPQTFATKRDAEVWLSGVETDLRRGDWFNPDAGAVDFAGYAAAWVNERPNLRPKTVQLYEGLVRLHLVPLLGDLQLGEIKEATVRRWRKSLLDSGVGPVTVAKAYRLLRAVLNTAVDDELIRQNPCRIKGADKEASPERPVLTLPQVFQLAEDIGPRYRALVLLAVFAGLRWGELAALQRKHVDLDAGTVRVERAMVELKNGRLLYGPPKSEAGNRRVSIPQEIVPEVRWHLDRFAEDGEEGLVFVGPDGAPLRRSNFSRRWATARDKVGVAGLHFHDLRHTGNTLAAVSGAGLRELMARMGHSTVRAALIYLHATSERDRAIADGIGQLVSEARKGTAKRSGTQRARRRAGGEK